MEKFKLKPKIILKLPEVEIEAETREEAEEEYMDLYEKEEMGGLPEIDFEDEESEEDEIDEEEDYEEEGLIRLPLKECKIYELEREEMPEEILDDIEYVLHYLENGYECLGGISEESRIMKFKKNDLG